MRDALLVIDVQNGLFADPDWPPFAGEAVVARIAGLVAKARAAGAKVIFVQHDGGPGDPLEAGTPGFALRPELAPAPGETVIVKRFCSAFQETGLAAALTGVNGLVICGLASDYCVDTSVRAAFERGFAVTLVEDAHSTSGNGVLPAGEIVRHHSLTLARGGFATLRPAAAVAF